MIRHAHYLSIIAALIFLAVGGAAEGEKVFPGGILRNNPGNLIKTQDSSWVGMTKLQDHERFVRFIQPVYGIRAMMKNLLAYQEKHNLNTISQIVRRWAPPSENNTSAYIHEVSIISGFLPDEPLNLKDLHSLITLAKAIVLYENGYSPPHMAAFWYPDELYYEAAEMALGAE